MTLRVIAFATLARRCEAWVRGNIVGSGVQVDFEHELSRGHVTMIGLHGDSGTH